MEHQYLGLAEVRGLAGLGELFDTLVVFENYPVDRAGLSAEVGGLRLTDFRGLDATHYCEVFCGNASLKTHLAFLPKKSVQLI